MRKSCFFLFLLALATGPVFSQATNADLALQKGNEAVELMDAGKFAESLSLLREAEQLDPANVNYPYEIAYAYYAQKEWEKAKVQLESLRSRKDANDHVYQLLGNTYDNLGSPRKAIETYEAGLKKFPQSGPLFLEMGNMQYLQKDYDKALSYYEKGIQEDPKFPSNYFRAALLYCNSEEEVWGMIYGEIFMNLERNTARTADMSKLLFDTYRSAIQIKSDTAFSISFSKGVMTIPANFKKGDTPKLPYGIGVYEPTIGLAIVGEKKVDLSSLNRIRTAFVKSYFALGHNKEYPNVLFSYQSQLANAGHLEAYNYWILMKGEEAEFEKWEKANGDKWKRFVAWFREHPLPLNQSNKFYRKQY